MGNVTSRRLDQWLDLHRFLGLAVCHSTTADPRHLEHYNYTYWTGDVAALIVGGQCKYCLIAPQFPMYVSPKEPSRPDATFGSGVTDADGEAEGVYVDIAIVMPIVEPRDPEELGVLATQVAGKSLYQFFDKIVPQRLPGLSPRCLWVSGLEAPFFAELKPLPSRHVGGIESFWSSLTRLLRDGALQAEAQALCLFCSSRFGTQEDVVILTGAGDYYRIRRVTRAWSRPKLKVAPYTSNTLKDLKAAARERLDLADDGDWTEGKEEEMYGDPLSTKERQKKLNEQRIQRAKEEHAKRTQERADKWDAQHQQFMDALKTQPSADRTTPLFTNEALNAVHRKDTNKDLFETRDPETFFNKNESSEWSQVLQLGSKLSNQYMKRIQVFIRTFEDREEERRKVVSF